jgi:Ni2+-binding GTPase involved in maturation of urease and hydrogenase
MRSIIPQPVIAAKLADAKKDHLVIYVSGSVGMGKTTAIENLLRR